MKILITNDDGINAPGINSLAETLAVNHRVYVVAPDSEKSATAAAITLHSPLKIKEHHPHGATRVVKYYSVNGMPADCVKIALRVILKESDVKPDAVISGINHGPNMGVDIRYSGTVSAAYEGLYAGIPSIAVSSASYGPHPNYETASRFISENIEKLVKKCHEFNNRFLLNVNVPSREMGQIKGARITRINRFRYEDSFLEIRDPGSRPYYWLSGVRMDVEPDECTDVTCVANDFISITPLQSDQTDFDALGVFKNI